MGVHRLNHAVLYVRDVARSVEFYGATLGFRPIEGMDGLTGAAFLRAPGSTNDHDLGLFQIGSAATDSAGRPQQRRALPPGVGGRHARRARADRRRALGARRARRRHRPRDHEGALRQGPRRAGVRGLLAGAGRAADRRHPHARAGWPRSTWPPTSTGSAPTPSAASASPSPRPPELRRVHAHRPFRPTLRHACRHASRVGMVHVGDSATGQAARRAGVLDLGDLGDVDPLLAGVRQARVSRPVVDRRHAERREPRHVGPAELRLRRLADRGHERGRGRLRQARQCTRRRVAHRDVEPVEDLPYDVGSPAPRTSTARTGS